MIFNISPFGLQLKDDVLSNEFDSNPIFYCSDCLRKYDYYCLCSNKLILNLIYFSTLLFLFNSICCW